MPLYEHVFIARQDISPQQVEGLTEQFKTVLTSLGGSVEKTEYWGLKNFAYRMKRFRKGHYVLLNVNAPAPALKELERQEGIHEDIVRTLTVRVDVLDPEQSAVLQNRGRDDRGERGDRGDRGDRGPRRDRGDRGDRGDRPYRPRRDGDDEGTGEGGLE